MCEQEDAASSSQAISDSDRAILEKDRETYDKIALEQAALLDKSIITISAAAFSIAIGFLDKLIPLATATITPVLWTSLSFLGLTIIITVFSFHASERSAWNYRYRCDEAERQGDLSIRYQKDIWATILPCLNYARLVLFIIGMITLLSFILYNGLTKGDSKNGSTTTTTQAASNATTTVGNSTGWRYPPSSQATGPCTTTQINSTEKVVFVNNEDVSMAESKKESSGKTVGGNEGLVPPPPHPSSQEQSGQNKGKEQKPQQQYTNNNSK